MNAQSYIRRETGVSIVINSVLSLLFFLLVFGMRDPIPTWGMGQWVFDFLPQSFMIALMSTLVPGFLTAKKLHAGQIAPIDYRSSLPRNLIARALVLAIASAAMGTALVAGIVTITGVEALPHLAALVLKVIYGALLAILVTPLGLRAALATPSRASAG